MTMIRIKHAQTPKYFTNPGVHLLVSSNRLDILRTYSFGNSLFVQTLIGLISESRITLYT